MNPFAIALAEAASLLAEAKTASVAAGGTIAAHVDTKELFQAAAEEALGGLVGGPAGVAAGAVNAIVSDLPKIATPADQQMFLAALAFAQEVYNHIHPQSVPK